MRNRLSKLAIGTLFALGLLIVGVGVSAATDDTLNVGLAFRNMGSLDPIRSTASQDVIVLDSVYDALVRFRPGSMNPEHIEPDLATRWESSGDGLIWTFYLREGVQFHHGYGELTAEDVVFSLERAKDPDQSAFASDYEDIERIEAIDRYTVRITLASPVPSLLGLVANYHGGLIVSKEAALEHGDQFGSNPVGTGPFAFESFTPQQEVVLSRHDAYFRGTPEIAQVTYRYMPDLGSRQLAFEAGELDMMEGQREQYWVDQMRDKGYEVDIVGPGEMRTLHFNMNMEPLGDRRVREAIARAIDRELLMTFLGADVTEVADSPVPAGYLGYTSDPPSYPHDVERAEALLREAGYPDGLDLGEVIITQTDSLRRPMEVLEGQLARAGIDLTLRVVDHPTFHDQIRENLSPLVLYGAARFPTADPYLTQFYHSDSIVGTQTAVTNFSHYGEVIPGVDELIEAARVEPDPERQLELWAEAQERIMQDLPTFPLYSLNLVLLKRPEVELGYDFDSSMSLFYSITEKTRIVE